MLCRKTACKPPFGLRLLVMVTQLLCRFCRDAVNHDLTPHRPAPQDFGVHANSYYPLDISYFKSGLDSHMLDMLWNKYWVNTLAASPLLATRELATGQIRDIGAPVCGSFVC